MVRPPPSHVIQKLGHASVAIGFDIETHDLAESGGAGIGRFGHPWRSNASIFRLRIVQIGWAIGDCTLGGTIRERVERLVIPDGFAVSERATKKHGITNERANGDGVQIAQALEEFMRAVWSIHELQGVVVAHHIEFDAGVLDEELHRCGLDSWRPYWHIIATGGVCTMDPDIQAWIQRTFGNDRGAGEKNVSDEFEAVDHVVLQHRWEHKGSDEKGPYCRSRRRDASAIVSDLTRPCCEVK